jgi:hypothetical protein
MDHPFPPQFTPFPVDKLILPDIVASDDTVALDAAMLAVTTEAVCTELNIVKSLLAIADKTVGLL